MKALVIENEHEVDFSVLAFLKDNPELFETVKHYHFAKDCPDEQMVEMLRGRDTIIASSTWMYKDQLNDYLKIFVQVERKYNFFIHNFTTKLNEWSYDSYDFRDKNNRDLILQLFKKGCNIQFFDESQHGKVRDSFNLTRVSRNRHCYTCYDLKYSEEHDLFYLDNYYNTLEDEIEYKEKSKK